VEDQWHRAVSPGHAGCATWLLRAASLPYTAGLKANLGLYETGLKARTRASLPVVSIGNLTLGGTGKTTTTRTIARELLDRGLCPGIVLRGHKRKSGSGPVLVADGEALLVSVDEAGDEATMLARTTAGCPVAVGKRREKVIDLLAQSGAQVALLDDGFQYFRMARQVDLVLLDATAELARARVFPGGHLREPLSHLRRSTHALITHSDLAPEAHVAQITQTVARHAPHVPVMRCRHRPTGLYALSDPSEELPAEYLQGKRVLAVSALGNPTAFEGTLLGLGARVTEGIAFDDHHQYADEDYRTIRRAVRADEPDMIVVTEKDAVKLPPPPEGLPPVFALRVDLEITDGRDDWDAMLGLICNAAG